MNAFPTLEPASLAILDWFENHFQKFISSQFTKELAGVSLMIDDHLGWSNLEKVQLSRGKRIRPLLVILSCLALGGDRKMSLPVSMAVELLHNYSLIHDDIEDNSPLRRGRPTLWVKYGIPQAINTGDLIHSLAFRAIQASNEHFSALQMALAEKIFTDANIRLTEGQYLDIAFESRPDISSDEYWNMIEGKTAFLLGACAQLGAVCANVLDQRSGTMFDFGRYLGLAYQVKDDLLGIWGNEQITGKSASSDLLEHKKTLPVLYGLERDPSFRTLWVEDRFDPERLSQAMSRLEICGAREDSERIAAELTQKALDSLQLVFLDSPTRDPLLNLAQVLLGRQT